MADDEEEEPIDYAYEGERAEGEEVALSVTVEVDDKPRTKTGSLKLLGPRAGQGKASYPSGDTYEGGYADGKREGAGVYVYKAKGWRYEGVFKAGLRHGLGLMYYSNDERYHGMWEAGLKCGQGTMYFASKDIYTGEWKAGAKSGLGVYYFAATGGELEGNWEAGNCLSGTWLDKSGLAYTGRYENQLPSSDGEFKFPSGMAVKGYYAQAKQKDGSVALTWVQQDVIGPV
ncbi:hypothetical protein T492DRAFT_910751 [Pavlovales sp. CCMP2436]|nr:hypothetical protein T492DRAFT_910751 [Pavlovales sp. CCMP2436]